MDALLHFSGRPGAGDGMFAGCDGSIGYFRGNKWRFLLLSEKLTYDESVGFFFYLIY